MNKVRINLFRIIVGIGYSTIVRAFIPSVNYFIVIILVAILIILSEMFILGGTNIYG